MLVELRDITTIKPYLQNPRANDSAVDAVAASLQEFGFRQPIVVDEDGVIIVGHTRYKAALKLGMTQVPVHVARGLTPAQAKAYRIADNQTASISDWDDKLLPLELAELQQMDFDLNLTGFSPEELERLMDSAPGEGQTDPDDIPEPPDEAKTQVGDLWINKSEPTLPHRSGPNVVARRSTLLIAVSGQSSIYIHACGRCDRVLHRAFVQLGILRVADFPNEAYLSSPPRARP